MRFDRDQLQLHATWALPAALLTLAFVCWHIVASYAGGAWQGGGSAPGLACGFIAGLIILFEMLLWPRKVLRRFRIILPTKHWMTAHIWFGLACLPIAMAHCGYHWGGTLTYFLMLLLWLVVLSGAYGLAMQNIVPSWMLRNLPAETIYSQIDYVSRQSVDDLRRMLSAACGPRTSNQQQIGEGSARRFEAIPEADDTRAIVVGAVREIGRVKGRTLRTASVVASPEDATVLWNAFQEIEPFLLKGKAVGGPVTDPTRTKPWFDLLRRSCHDTSHDLIVALEQICDQRHQFDTQQRAHWWLHGWIPFHVAFSVALSILLVVHIITALKYW